MKRCLLFFLAVAIVALPSLPLFGQSVPEITYDSAPNLLKLPTDVFLGEAAGVAQNSKGHMFVFTRSCLNLIRKGTTFARSVRATTPLRLRTRCGSIRRTTFGRLTKGRT